MKALLIASIAFLNFTVCAQSQEYIDTNYILRRQYQTDGTYGYGIFDDAKNKWVKEGLTGFEISYEQYFNSFGFCDIKINNKVAFLDYTGKIIKVTNYDDVGAFQKSGLAIAYKKGQKNTIININFEEIIIEPTYDYIQIDDHYGEGNYAYVGRIYKNQNGNYVDRKTNEEIFPDKDGKIYNWEGYDQADFEVAAKKKWGLIDKTGKLITQIEYDEIGTSGSYSEYGWVVFFEDGLCPVKMNGKYGFIDTKGKIIIPIVYDYVHNFFDGFAAVSVNNKWGIINKKNQIIIPINYEGIFPNMGEVPASEEYPYFSQGLCPVAKKINDEFLWGFVNLKGVEVITLKYDRAEEFNKKGLSLVTFLEEEFYINTKGEKVKNLEEEEE